MCFIARLGKFSNSHALSASEDYFSSAWVIDSGATDHMTSFSHWFSSYNLYLGNRKINVADGTLAIVAGQGTKNLSPTLSLKSILHILRLSVNLFESLEKKIVPLYL